MPKTENVIEESPPSVLVTLAKKLEAADKKVTQLEEELKQAKAVSLGAEKALVEEMITQQVKSFKTEAWGGFRTQAVVYPNVIDREALNDYVKKKKLKWLYTVAVNGNKLRSWVKELIEEGKKIPPGIEPYTTTVIRRF